MMCEDARTLSVERALGGLESVERRALDEHLASCGECRAAADLDDRTVAALKSDALDKESEVRRERTVAAMAAVRRIPRRRWIAASVAAALLLALTVPMLLPRAGLAIERLDGTAWIGRAGGGRVPAALGDRLRSGDRLEAQGVVALEGADNLRVLVHRDSEIVYEAAGDSVKIRLAKGAVRVDAPEKPVAILDPLDRRAVVHGACEARFSAVMGYPRKPEARSEFQVHVRKGGVRFEGTAGVRALETGQILTVTEEGTVEVEDPPPAEPERKQP